MSAIITVITGVPGSGKSALALDLVLKHYKDRPLFVDNFEGLKIDHTPFDVMNWHTEVPDGAVVLCDEIQRKWRPRGPSVKVPDCIAQLETHRHRCVDFILITQNLKLIDSNVRALAGRHLHIRNTGWMGRWLYEWPEVDPSNSWKRCDNKRRYRLPKHVFNLYTSASMHAEPVRNRPILLYVIAAAVIALCYFLWSIYDGFTKQVNSSTLDPSQLVEQIPSITPASVLSGMAATATPASEKPKIDDRVDWVPRLSHMPETAPAFDAIREVRQMPVVAGGVCFQGECKCFTQQGTNAGLSHDDCLTAMNNPRFDAYSQPQAVQAQHSPTLSRNQSPENLPSEVRTAVALTNQRTQLEVTQAAKTSRLLATGGL